MEKNNKQGEKRRCKERAKEQVFHKGKESQRNIKKKDKFAS